MRVCKQCKRNLDKQNFIQNEKEFKSCNKCREENLLKIREINRLQKSNYRLNHPEEYKAKRRTYYLKNIDRSKEEYRKRIINRPGYFFFSSARRRARKYNLIFNITEQDIEYLIKTTNECPLRKVPFKKGCNHKANDDSISIDRIDPTRGYTKNNIQILSYKANRIKNNINLETFRKIVDNFINFNQSIHSIDDNTRQIIIKDRLDQINENNCNNYRLIHLESFLLEGARKRAEKHNLISNINVDYLKSIWPLDNKCPILKEKFMVGKGVVSDQSATIDRINNDNGYVKGNIRIISNKANNVKNNANIEELKFILKNWEKII